MQRGPTRRLALWLAAPLLLGCSLMNLDDFSERRCRSDTDCLPAQRSFGDATRCEYYACREGSCVPSPGVEICNHEDDDCDGRIDNGISVLPHEVLDTSSEGVVMASAVSPSGARAYVVGGSDALAQGIVVSSTVTEPPFSLRYASAVADGEHPERPCPVMTSAGVDGSGCRFNDVALAADEEQLVYATINTAGCASGQLRVGLAAASVPFRIWLGSSALGEMPRSNVELGIDVGDGQCSGASARGDDGEPAGARSPAVAILDLSPSAAGGLVTWLAARYSPSPAPCGSLADAPVHVLGVLVPKEAQYAEQKWLVGSNEGKPPEIGRSSSLRPPAVVGLTASGSTGHYLVAFPSKREGADGVALVLVAVRAPELTFTDAGFIADEAPDLVSLGTTSSGDSAAIAWRSGCGAKSTVKLAVITLEKGSLTSSSVLSLAVGSIDAKPQLLHRSDGFTTRRDGGGWYVMWSEKMKQGGRTRLTRVADDLSSLDAEPATVTTGGVGLPLLFPDHEASLNHGLLTVRSREAPQARVFAGWCN